MKERVIESFDGNKICCYLWDNVKNPIGVVQIFHGMAEHATRYDEFAKFLNKNGYIVFADDHRGHGKTAGSVENIGQYEGGNIFRSGLTYFRGIGKVFYFQPGHETNPIFHNEYVQKIITNAVYWVKPNDMVIERPTTCPHRKNPVVELEEAKTAE